MFEENEECPKCHSQTVRHDRVKGNVKCFESRCGFIVETHYQTFEQEVNNYENDPDQVNKMRGLVQDGKDFKIKIGKEIIDESRKKKKGDEDNYKKAIKNIQNWGESLGFDKREVFQITTYYNILLNESSQVQQTPAGNPQKQTGISILNRKIIVAFYILAQQLQLDEEFSKKSLCERFCVSLQEVEVFLTKIQNKEFEGKEKIADILFPKQDLKYFSEEYSEKAGLNDDDKAGYIALCNQIKEQEISNGEQMQTKAAAALYFVFKLSNDPNTNSKSLKFASEISGKSDHTINKFFTSSIKPNWQKLLDGIKYQQYNWKSNSEIRKLFD